MARAGSAIILACAVLLGGGGAAIAVPSSELALRGVFLQGTDLALDAEGHRHIAATGAPNDLWYATDRSGAWIARRVLRGVQGSYAWSQPSITVDEAGRVHIAAVKVALWDTPDTTDGIWYVTDRGRRRGDFGPRRRVAGDMMTGPSLRVVGGVRYLAYYRCLCGPGIAAAGGSTAAQARHPLFFKTDRTGRWTKELVADVGFYPSLRVGAEGRARIAYSDRSGVRFTSARTRLGDFTRPVRIPGSVEAHVSLALGDRGQPHVAWAGGSHRSQVAYSRRSREGWRSARLLGDGTDAELSIDAAGRPHVAFARTTSVVHRWLRRDGWARQVIARTVRTRSIDVRAFGRRANIVWAQWDRPMGVWITPPTD